MGDDAVVSAALGRDERSGTAGKRRVGRNGLLVPHVRRRHSAVYVGGDGEGHVHGEGAVEVVFLQVGGRVVGFEATFGSYGEDERLRRVREVEAS